MKIRFIAFMLVVAISPCVALADQTATLYPPSAHTGGATIVLLPNVRVPQSSAAVTVYGHSAGGGTPQRLATLYLVGSSQLSGDRTQTLRATVNARSATLRALINGGTITVVACPSGGGSCLTTGPVSIKLGPSP